ncbi:MULTISPECIES: hypothetical protein [unclassified Rhodococcus (in: high G+C Gram-positive bacteria)]|uniref:hypothetical protein n=1 Tax=unclassified Rhodococcus (in: high G+C Gram-positive bacteria) TaxID=192944 RepID=UPI00037998AF|nr:hypothetical protein [Rhodococcus sp. DK17]
MTAPRESDDEKQAETESRGFGDIATWWHSTTWVTRLVMFGIAVLFLLIGYFLGRCVEVPGASEFWAIAAQPLATLFAGLAALGAATLAYVTGRRAWGQAKEHHRSDRCWSRLQWVIDKGSSPGSRDSGLSEALREKILDAIESEAFDLDDAALKEAVAAYSDEVIDRYLDVKDAPPAS